MSKKERGYVMRKRGKVVNWDFELRRELSVLLKEGFNLSQVVSYWNEIKGFSPTIATLQNEVRKGLTEEEFEKKFYLKYDIFKVYRNLLGDDAIEFIARSYSEQGK